ncbi:hypothetical protein B0H14DRAFT_3644596 [Mycena olivaceomarginata]|nr:hypothetical protein B0H14DRAFT_3644596 [Mycena olivaceomarginata]
MVVEEAMPTALSLNTSCAGISFLLIISSGSQHFNIYKGLFTKNGQPVPPFFFVSSTHESFDPLNQTSSSPDVPFGVAMKACPDIGDDTLHTPHEPLPTYCIPDFIASCAPDVDVGGDPNATAPIDLIFIDFFGVQLIRTLNTIQMACMYSRADARVYNPGTLN